MAKKYNTIRFTFTGSPIIGKNFFTEGKDKYDNANASLNLGIKVKNDTEFARLFGTKREEIRTVDTDNNTMVVSWADRDDPQVVEKVATYRRFRTNIGTDDATGKTFISDYDFIQYLATVLPDYQGDLTITGRMVLRYDNKGILHRNYNIEGVWARRDSEKEKLSMIVPFTYWKDCVDKSDLKTTGKITINGYVMQNISKEDKDKYVPLSVVLNTKSFTPEKLAARMELLDTKSRTPITSMWDIRVVNGAQEVEFDESQLSGFQRRLIASGDNVLEDFRPRAKILGDREKELRFCQPICTADEFADGFIDTCYKVSEFEDEIYVPTKDETIDEMETIAKPASKPAQKPATVLSDDEMF